MSSWQHRYARQTSQDYVRLLYGMFLFGLVFGRVLTNANKKNPPRSDCDKAEINTSDSIEIGSDHIQQSLNYRLSKFEFVSRTRGRSTKTAGLVEGSPH